MVKSLSEELGTSWAVFLLSVKAAATEHLSDKIALSMDSIYVSAGKRGQEIRIVPNAFTVLLDASFVTLTNYD